MVYNCDNMMMKTKIIQKFPIIMCLLVLFFAFFVPKETHAETPFGGMLLITLGPEICSCSGNSHWIMDYTSGSLLMLYYEEGQSKLFNNNDVDYGTYQLGTYSSSSQSCSIDDGEGCIDIENDGTYGSEPGTGTSMNSVLKDKKFLTLLSPKSLNNSFSEVFGYLNMTNVTKTL